MIFNTNELKLEIEEVPNLSPKWLLGNWCHVFPVFEYKGVKFPRMLISIQFVRDIISLIDNDHFIECGYYKEKGFYFTRKSDGVVITAMDSKNGIAHTETYNFFSYVFSKATDVNAYWNSGRVSCCSNVYQELKEMSLADLITNDDLMASRE